MIKNSSIKKNVKRILKEDLQGYIFDEWITEKEVFLSFYYPFPTLRMNEYKVIKNDESIQEVREIFEEEVKEWLKGVKN